jgi:glycosyltransferase involved in cell wall biosynthesis
MVQTKGSETKAAIQTVSYIHVSIVTPLYNSAEFIADTIRSVQAQTHSNWEMLIVDDFSTDNGADIVRLFAENDKRIKLISLDENCGAAVARNKAIEVASGEFIAFLDSDDLWKPQKLEKQLFFMKENNYSFSFTSYEIINDAGVDLKQVIKADKLITYSRALRRNPIGCLTAMYSVTALGKVYMPLIRKRQDQGLWLKILREGTIAYGLNEPLALYRLRKNSISSKKLDLVKYQWQLYRHVENLGFLRSLYYLIAVTYNRLIRY